MTIFNRDHRPIPPSENPTSIWLADVRIKQMNNEHAAAKGDGGKQTKIRARQDDMLDLRLWLRWCHRNGLQ